MAFDDGVKTVSGSVAHTDDAATKVPFVSVKCGIEPTLDGVTTIDAVRPDGNILETVAQSQTQNGVTWTVNADGSVTLEGTSTARTYLYVRRYFKILPHDATITVSVEGLYRNGTSNVFLNLPYSDNGTTYSGSYGQVTWDIPKRTINYTADKYIGFLLDCPANVTTNQTIKVMVTIGSEAQTFAPYQTPTQYTASLGRTIYGGSADIVNGTGTENYAYIDLSQVSWTNFTSSGNRLYINTAYPNIKAPASNSDMPECICNAFPTISRATMGYSAPFTKGITIDRDGLLIIANPDDTTWTSKETAIASLVQMGAVCAIPLATPTDFTFTPITPTPESVGKVNNVYCNTGDTELTYHDNAHGFAEVTVNKTGRNLFSLNRQESNPSPTDVFVSPRVMDVTKYYRGIQASNYYYKNYVNASISDGVLTVMSTNNNNYGVGFPVEVKPNTTYTLSGTFTNCLNSVGCYDENWNFIERVVNTNNTFPHSFTTSANAKYALIVISTLTNVEGTAENIQLEVGSTAHAYEPYTTPTVYTAYLHKVIYGGTADVVRGTCEPKNLFDDSTFPRTATDNTYYAQFQSNLAEGNKYKIPTIHIEPDVAYVLSFDVECNTEPFNASVGIGIGSYSRDIANANNNTSGRISIPFTLTSALKEQYGDILSFRVPRYSTPREFTFTISNVQLEKASSASEYAPHFEPFSFPPISIGTDEGENTLFANEGDSAITYRKAVD